MAFTWRITDKTIEDSGATAVVVEYDNDGAKMTHRMVFIPGTSRPDAVGQIREAGRRLYDRGVNLSIGETGTVIAP